MIIKPFKPIDPYVHKSEFKCGFMKQDGVWVKERYAINGNNIRKEKISLNENKKTLTRESFLGYFTDEYSNLGHVIKAKNSMRTILDLNNGKVSDWFIEDYIPSESNNSMRQLFGNPEYTVNDAVIRYQDKLYNSKMIESISSPSIWCDTTSYDYFITDIENKFQFYFYELCGLISSFFSQWSFMFPFESYVIIDTDKGFSIPKITAYSFIDSDIRNKILAKYVGEIDKLVDILKKNCQNYKRSFFIKIFTSDFCNVIKIRDKKYNVAETIPISNSSLYNSLILNAIDNPKNYPFSEEIGLLLLGNYGDIIDEMISSLDYLSDTDAWFYS